MKLSDILLNYTEAISPTPYTILGVELQPLSIQHYLLMQRFEVGFVSEGECTADLTDLIFGVLICSTHWKTGEFEAWIRTPKAKRKIQNWSKSIGPFDEAAKIQLFSDYISTNSRKLPYWSTGGNDGPASGAHWAQCILLTLTSNCGYTRDQALHAPLLQALADYFRYAETQGTVQILPEYEIERLTGAPPTTPQAGAA